MDIDTAASVVADPRKDFLTERGVATFPSSKTRHKHHGWVQIKSSALPITLSIVMFTAFAVLAGCDQTEQPIDLAVEKVPVDLAAEDQQPMGHVMEFEDFTLQANVSRTDALPDSMTQQYGINPDPNLALLSLVILEHQSGRQPAAVPAEVSAQQESLTGRVEAIDMHPVEANGYVSYIGTLDASFQRVFQFIIQAQPAGTDRPLHMDFEVQLETFKIGDIE